MVSLLKQTASGFLLLPGNTRTQKQVGQERVYLAYIYSISMYITKGSRDPELKHIRNLEARCSRRGAVYSPASLGLFSLCYRTSTTSRGGTTHLRLGPPPLITN